MRIQQGAHSADAFKCSEHIVVQERYNDPASALPAGLSQKRGSPLTSRQVSLIQCSRVNMGRTLEAQYY